MVPKHIKITLMKWDPCYQSWWLIMFLKDSYLIIAENKVGKPDHSFSSEGI